MTQGKRSKKRGNVALRLQTSLLEEAKRVGDSEGVALNQLINVAVAEKLSALRTEDYFRERSSRANIDKAKRILKRAGAGENLPCPATSGRQTDVFFFRHPPIWLISLPRDV